MSHQPRPTIVLHIMRGISQEETSDQLEKLSQPHTDTLYDTAIANARNWATTSPNAHHITHVFSTPDLFDTQIVRVGFVAALMKYNHHRVLPLLHISAFARVATSASPVEAHITDEDKTLEQGLEQIVQELLFTGTATSLQHPIPSLVNKSATVIEVSLVTSDPVLRKLVGLWYPSTWNHGRVNTFKITPQFDLAYLPTATLEGLRRDALPKVWYEKWPATIASSVAIVLSAMYAMLF